VKPYLAIRHRILCWWFQAAEKVWSETLPKRQQIEERDHPEPDDVRQCEREQTIDAGRTLYRLPAPFDAVNEPSGVEDPLGYRRHGGVEKWPGSPGGRFKTTT